MKCLRQFTQNEISLFKTSSWLFPHHFVYFNLYIVPLTEYKPFLILLFLFLSISTCQYAKGKWATSYFQSDPNDRRGQGKPGVSQNMIKPKFHLNYIRNNAVTKLLYHISIMIYLYINNNVNVRNSTISNSIYTVVLMMMQK